MRTNIKKPNKGHVYYENQHKTNASKEILNMKTIIKKTHKGHL